MRLVIAGAFLFLPLIAQESAAIQQAATKFVPDVTWHSNSVVSGDFTCTGRKQPAILGLNTSEIVIAVFVNGTQARPEVLRYSSKARNSVTAKLKIEDLDYNPKEVIGVDLPGFRRSKTCKGLNLADGETDSAHIYWNSKERRFDDWTL